MSTFNMGDLEGIVTAGMLLTLLSQAEDLAEDALMNLQYDGLVPDEYKAEKEEQEAYISTVSEVCRRIREKMGFAP